MNSFKGNEFIDIYDFIKKLTKKEKGDLFEEFTYYLFRLDPRLKNNLENIWMYKDIPNKILKELSLPAKDKGIDLLAKINGDFYAIQCKFRQDPDTIIPWADLSTFFGLSFGLNDKIAGGFFVTNTNDLCEEVIKSTKVEPIYGNFFDDLSKNFFDCIRNNNTKIKYIKKRPYQYQRACRLACEFHYLDFDRGHIEMACGTGKTLIAYWIDNRLHNEKTVVFVPSLYLLSQFYSDWVNQSYAEKIKINYLLVGSDANIDEEIKYKSNGLILHTDPKIIRRYIKNCNDKLVVICTYQSSDKLAEACENIEFDFGFFDEAHKTVGQVNKKFNMMLTDKYMTIKKRLFMTATPKIYAGDLEDDEIISMDNKKMYGDKLFTYNTGDAIKDGKLTDYQVLTIYAKNSDIERDIKKNKLVKFRNEFADEEANYLGIILVLLKKIHDGTCKHLITYHNRVKKAEKFRDFLEKINNLLYDEEIYVENLDGTTSMGKRTKIIKGFINSPTGILCSARVLNEGINIPIVDSICFVDPRQSTIDIVQCIGRSLRLYPGKEKAHIIVPTFIDNFDDEFDNNAYGSVIRILKALKTTDDGVVEYFKSRANGKIGSSRTICTAEYYDDRVDVSKEINLEKWNSGIETKIWQTVDNFEYMYEKVKEWIKENGKIPSEAGKLNTENKLGVWCRNRRRDKRNNKLNSDEIKKLETLNGWFWNSDDIFLSNYNKVKDWIEKNNKIPSYASKDENEKKLARWCACRRVDKRKGKLDKVKIEKLGQLNGWYWDKLDPFDAGYNDVKEWINKNGRIPSSGSKNKIENHLGSWCHNKRRYYKKGKLNKTKIKKLEQLDGWYWEKKGRFI